VIKEFFNPNEVKIGRIIFLNLRNDIYLCKTKCCGLPVSINDIRDKYFEDIPLTAEEKLALNNFDKYRMNYLNSAANEECI